MVDSSISKSSAALVAEDARLFLHQAESTPCISAVRRVEGIWIEDLEGRRYMDFHGNSVHHIGYAHPKLIAALKVQLDGLVFSPRRYTNDVAVALARKLAELAPKPLSKVLFAPSGSDAIEIALRLARAATGRHKTVSFWDAFHGAGFGASSVGGQALYRSGVNGPLLSGTEHVASFQCYRCAYGYPDRAGQPDLDVCKLSCANMLRYVLDKEGDVAAVIAEPIRSVCNIPPPGYWQAVRAACDAHGALLIFDEIPNGLGKTGRLFACEHWGVVPDILVLGKALGGGTLPIAALIAHADLDVANELSIGHYTHEKNPLTARAALTTLEIITGDGLIENARRVGTLALDRLKAMAVRHPLIGDVRGLGLRLAVELVRDRAEKTPATAEAESVMRRCLTSGLSFTVSAGNVLVLSPPLIITESEMQRALQILDAALGEEERRAA
ncbi:MAG: aspartate aminotransferase family protein [Alphaproteobacteria bacterium]|nr:aspartate aminotransferase family protein [Alphaproteobacteria bacterium]